jgi:hypothetical protein
MRKLIKKWLGVDKIENKIQTLEMQNTFLYERLEKYKDGGSVFNGEAVTNDSLKEFVYGIAKYLKLKPKRTFKEVPEITTTKNERVYEVIKYK